MVKYTSILIDYIKRRCMQGVLSETELNVTLEIPVHQIPRSLCDATKDIPFVPRANIIAELIHKRLRDDDELFEVLCAYTLKPKVDKEFRLILLEMLNKRVNSRRRIIQSFSEVLQKIAVSNNQPAELRSVALYMLNNEKRQKRPKIIKIIESVMESKNPLLMNTAAHIISKWLRKGQRVPKTLVQHIISYTHNELSEIAILPGILMAVANLETPEVRPIFNRLISNVNSSKDRVRILWSIGHRLDINQLAELVRQTKNEQDYESEVPIRSIFAKNNSLIDTLYQKGYYSEYLYILYLTKKNISNMERERLVELHTALNLKSPEFSGNLSKDAIPHNKKRLSYVTPTTRPEWIELPYNIGYHKADAIYTDLGFPIDNHWHALIYLGFSIKSNLLGCLSIVQASDNPFDCTHTDEVTLSLSDPGVSVRDRMKEFKQKLERKICSGFQRFELDGNSIDAFMNIRAVRRSYSMNADIAEKIEETARDMAEKSILYTPFDMLVGFFFWDGNIDDIFAIRCDGVVEFCYEMHGVKVCGRNRNNLWNITSAGNEYLDEHNNEHTFSYQDGELCPRIQAGDTNPNENHRGTQHVTRLTDKNAPQPPEITTFSVVPPTINNSLPQVIFKIYSERYEKVYVRLTVQKDNETYFLLNSAWKRYSTNVTHTCEWIGAALNGPDYRQMGNHGTYDFRLVAVDLGGNVSALLSQKVDIFWCSYGEAVPPDIAVKPEERISFGKVPVSKNRGYTLNVYNTSPCTELRVELEIFPYPGGLSIHDNVGIGHVVKRPKHFFIMDTSPTGVPIESIHIKATIEPGQYKWFYILFKPDEAFKHYNESLVVKHNVPNKPSIIIELNGTGMPEDYQDRPNVRPELVDSVDFKLADIEQILDILGEPKIPLPEPDIKQDKTNLK